MNQRQYTLTILPDETTLTGREGDNLYTLLLLAGLVERGNPRSEQLCLERGAVSPADQPEAEAAVFTAAQRTEGWLLASQRHVTGDAVLRRGEDQPECTSMEEAEPLSRGYGLAFDLGTSTIAAGLVDLASINIPQLTAGPNRQTALAPRLEDRQALARTEAGRQQLRGQLIEDMQDLITKLSLRTGVGLDQITVLTCAGSCLMLDLLAERQTEALTGKVRCFTSMELGLTRLEPLTQVYLLPVVSRDLGADVVSSCLAADLLHKMEQPEATLLVDLGAGGEIIGAGGGRMVAASIPDLPFEGNGIRYGIPAMTGAITQVELDRRVVVKTVRDGRPKGISGAGLLSAAHAMLEAGLLDAEGRICQPERLPPGVADRLRSGIDGRSFVLSPGDQNFPEDICISQEDILALQMAKGAIYGACRAVLAAMEMEPNQIREILLAEAYRAHLDPQDLLALGVTPVVAPQQMLAIGNAAWQGAFLCLSDRRCLEEAEQTAAALQRVDLNTDSVYAEEFIKGMRFVPDPEAPETRPKRRLAGDLL